MKAVRRDRLTGFVFTAGVFLFFVLFFSKLYPIVISTTDDYYGVFNHRQALPQWRGSEPIRVIGAVFMPMVSQIMAWFYRVLGGNLFDYLTFGWAVCVAGAIAGLIAVMYKMLRKANVSSMQACAGLFLFLLLHFWIFKQRQQDGNMYMLQTVYACTYFIYVIPNFLNAILALWFHTDPDIRSLLKPGKYLKKAIFVFSAYFAINSNIWAGAIFAAYLGMRLITETAATIRSKKTVRTWFGENYTMLLLLAVWFVSQLFEMNGIRASVIGQNLFDGLSAAWKYATDNFRKVNIRYLIFAGAVVAGGLVSMCFRKDKKSLVMIGKVFIALILFITYLLLTCAKVGNSAYYIARPDVFYGAFFFGAVMILVCFFELLKRFPVGKLIVPLLLVVILVDCNSMGRTYRDSVSDGRHETYATHNRINQDILSQLQEAEAAGLKETKLYIPDYNTFDNWPYAIYAGEPISKGFYKLGALGEEIRITEIVPSTEKNRELGIGEP